MEEILELIRALNEAMNEDQRSNARQELQNFWRGIWEDANADLPERGWFNYQIAYTLLDIVDPNTEDGLLHQTQIIQLSRGIDVAYNETTRQLTDDQWEVILEAGARILQARGPVQVHRLRFLSNDADRFLELNNLNQFAGVWDAQNIAPNGYQGQLQVTQEVAMIDITSPRDDRADYTQTLAELEIFHGALTILLASGERLRVVEFRGDEIILETPEFHVVQFNRNEEAQ